MRIVFQLSEITAEVAASRCHGLEAIRFPEVAGTVDGNRPQPGSKRSRALVVLESRKAANDHCQDVLNEVVSIARLDAHTIEPVTDEGCIQLDEPTPGDIIRVA